MIRVSVSREIAAPVERIFTLITDIENLPKTNPDVASITFLTEQKSGAGTKFSEVRLHNGKEMITHLEITEFRQNEHARMVADSHGTVWDTAFSVTPSGDGSKLTINMDAIPHTLFARIMTFLFQKTFRKGMEKHIDNVKAYCEKS